MQRNASATCVTYMIPWQTHDQLGVELFKAICRRDKHRHHELGKHVLPSIMGYALGTGGGWTSDLLIADREAMANHSAISRA